MVGQKGELYRFRLFGRAELLDPRGCSVSFKTRKLLLLLVVLSQSEGRRVSRKELSACVWPAASEQAARANLRNGLAALRRALPDGALATLGNDVAIVDGWLDTSFHLELSEAKNGEFMPGFQEDWVLDRRIGFRAEGADLLMAEAERLAERGDLGRAIELARGAAQLDPLNSPIAKRASQLLRIGGKAEEASLLIERHRSKSIRELGVLPNLDEAMSVTAQHPLIAAAEWLVERSPSDALSMLAELPDQWLFLPVGQSIRIHRMVLELNTRDTACRRLVWAQYAQLQSMAGTLSGDFHGVKGSLLALHEAGESLASARLACAYAYSNLSRGRFDLAERLAEQSVQLAECAKNTRTQIWLMHNLGIIYEHVGKEQLGEDTIQKAGRLLDSIDAPQLHAAQSQLTFVRDLRFGLFERAAESLERSRRIYREGGFSRPEAWLLYGEGQLHAAMGEHETAKALLQRVASHPADESGHAAAALATDSLAAVEFKMDSLDVAAECLAKARVLRRKHKSVRSVAERKLTWNVRHGLMQKLGERELRAVFRRVESSAAQNGSDVRNGPC